MFLNLVVHDLRNPTTQINMSSKFASEKLDEYYESIQSLKGSFDSLTVLKDKMMDAAQRREEQWRETVRSKNEEIKKLQVDYNRMEKLKRQV